MPFDVGQRLDRRRGRQARHAAAGRAPSPRRACPARAACAVSALSRISPASEAASISTVRLAAGPVTRSSRCDSPTRKNWKRARVEAGVHLQLDRAGGRLRAADRAERAAHLERRPCRPRCVIVAVVEQQQRVAAELEQAAALAYATASSAAKVAFITSVTSSAPARPRLERRSDIAVKPEMSMNASVPSTSRQCPLGLSRSHSRVSRGTNGTSSAEAGDGCIRRGHRMILAEPREGQRPRAAGV